MKSLLLLACSLLHGGLDGEPGDLLWPFGSGVGPYRLRARYAQAEGSGTVSLHCGLDVIPNRSGQKVYALESGRVVGTVDDHPYLSGLLVESSSVPDRAFLYLHLDERSLQVGEDDEVEVDDWIGNVVRTDTVTGVPHLHLARLGGAYLGADWAALSDLSVRDPLALIDPELRADEEKPVIAPGITVDSLAAGALVFRRNENPSSTARFYYPTQPLPAGKLDVLARVHDSDGRSENLLAPYSLTLKIAKGNTVEEFALCLDRPPPKSGPDIVAEAYYNQDNELATVGVDKGTKPSELAYYYVLTNGGEDCSVSAGQAHAWAASPGEYDLELLVKDVAGNASAAKGHVVVQ